MIKYQINPLLQYNILSTGMIKGSTEEDVCSIRIVWPSSPPSVSIPTSCSLFCLPEDKRFGLADQVEKDE